MRRRRWAVLSLVALLGVLAAWLGLRTPTPGPSAAPPVASTPSARRDVVLRPRTLPRSVEAPPPPVPVAPDPVEAGDPERIVTDGGVDGPPVGERGRIDLRIRDARGAVVDPAMVVTRGDCGDLRFRVTEGEGEVDVAAGRCTLRATRWDGALPTHSEPVDVDVRAGDVSYVDLVLPTERTGGLGVRIARHPDGVLVYGVVPGSPADAAGLRAGDVIVEVDGTPAALLTLPEFQQVMTGPEGTRVDFVLSYEGDTGLVEEPVEVTRAFLEG